MATHARFEGDTNEVYYENLNYAFRHGEPEKFRMSRRCDYDCCSQIMDLDKEWKTLSDEEKKDGFGKIIEEFGLERCEYVAAATIMGNSRLDIPEDMTKWAEDKRLSVDRFVNATNTLIIHYDVLSAFLDSVKAKEKENEKNSPRRDDGKGGM